MDEATAGLEAPVPGARVPDDGPPGAGMPAVGPLADDAGRVLGELAIEAAGIGTFDWDLVTGRLVWDEQLDRLFGYEPGAFDHTLDAFLARLHPDDVQRVSEALRRAIEVCGEYSSEYRVVAPDGTTRWVAAKGRALAGVDGAATRLLGAAFDTTARNAAEQHIARVLEAMSSAFFSVGRDWRFGYVNAEAERLLERPRDELVGQVLWDLFPAARGSEFEVRYREAMDSGVQTSFEAYYPAPLDAWFEVRAWPGPDGLAVYFFDITARRAAEVRAAAAVRRADLVASVSAELTETLDGEVAVARLAQLVVPELADWCIVTLVDDDAHAGVRRGLRDIASWHVDPELRPVVARYAHLRLDALGDRSPLIRALESGRPATTASGATAELQEVMAPGEARDLLEVLAPGSKVVLPLRGRGRTVGLLSLFTGTDRGPLREDDLVTAQEVAGRAGLALDNSRLYRQQRRVAESLQRSLLTDPPEPDHLQISVRYEPAAESAQVGGDWYDAFLQRSGDTVLVIGDVVGHDIDAAAAMGQLRSLLRGIAVATGAGPSTLLTEVDLAIRTLQLETLASAVVLRVEQTAEERERGVTRVRWSNAGHPAPAVLHADGRVELMEGGGTDLLLGVIAGTRRTESELVLERGSTVLLYTDGLVERRSLGLREGMAALVRTLADVGGADLEALCDAVLDRMVPARPEDDVALVAVRLHPQDRPRPAEAGPRRVPEGVPPE